MKSCKLNKLDMAKLDHGTMNNLSAGSKLIDFLCGCSCAYASKKGSGTASNHQANTSGRKNSPGTISYELWREDDGRLVYWPV